MNRIETSIPQQGRQFKHNKMPSEFHVVRCHVCNMYQVQQKKKSLKWQCKMCNNKQSLNRVYGEGSGKECRIHVQKLNMLGANVEINFKEPRASSETSSNDEVSDTPVVEHIDSQSDGTTTKSKWSIFMDSDSESLPADVDSDKIEKQLVYSPVKCRKTSVDSLPSDERISNTPAKFAILPQPEESQKCLETDRTPRFLNHYDLNNISLEELDDVFEL